jgi:hypothetical protein
MKQQFPSIESALEFMRDNAKPLAEAKAQRIYLEQFRKTQKALLIQQATGTIQEKDSYAYAHEDYIQVLDGLKVAVEQEEFLRWKMTAAQAYVEVWRSKQANNRLIDKGHV